MKRALTGLLWNEAKAFRPINPASLGHRYDLLDEQVRFLKGWFKDTLPPAPVERLAVLRLDGDMYESTMGPHTPLPETFPRWLCDYR